MTSEKMKVSVCVTTKNEREETIKKLFDALNNQTLKPNEIIIIDAKDYDNCSRSIGRNIAIKKAKNEIIALTDVGCLPKKDWLEKLTKPFQQKNIDVVAGFYNMTYKNNLQKSMRKFLGVLPSKFNKQSLLLRSKNFLPSARSMAFTKSIWKKAGGFPEKLSGTAEDTLFNVNLIKAGVKFVTAKNAIVEWGMPETISNFQLAIFNYAEGDGQAGIWWHPTKRFQSHNIKISLIYLRYLLAFIFLAFGYYGTLGVFTGIYMLYAFGKAGLWGLILQPVSDIAVMAGFIRGIMTSK
ncbi:hypothetical protein A2130_04055 [Candidatus Woesebacteria bacterium GWC2_33_12]|uniref:Glycosyltransferase 2-like domain-containing protein n=1 Tax=Candidatus Woesebacteria bacterium GW2011_GWB1_33_22 TaxID=1618566 RepID=A0A0F9ZMS0_9BACT|nr:MAG: hypothetical protein UR29_C0001G0133 [Candidatus Woesebacteria bacterium GW2011_GWC2_33_12]KKP42657.1 MAG: hypothetical protein UR33_C0001G0018 [Candidatus Woesebacteria bacterium GW2011_GWA2_33_20]KKP45568.1 MAG: hypothetical protein UR35_C0001G0165 [Candidatus Woesebacteria bacterium GW2011_GWB1_33_22]KKP47440.1 MAG: hypothetical protein UR37_C0001G0133 [Microgenomates group bacterium GW2011_GWC1_33_28]KKP51186.1 MAG: hypothetical protein UR41_C0001G0133 [Candidatus Woesebacteria bact